MTALTNTARNPWDGTYVSPEITDERHEVGYFNPDLGLAYTGIRLIGAPEQNAVFPVRIWIINDLETGARISELTETPGTPELNQFRVDYGKTEEGFAGGMIWINVPTGTPVSADYRSRGGVFHVENLLRLASEILLPVGITLPYTGLALPPGNWIWADGSSYSRTGEKAQLFALYNIDRGAVTISVANPGIVTLLSHGFQTRDRVALYTGGSLPTGLLPNRNYYVIYIDADNFALATNEQNAAAGIGIQTTAAGSGDHTLLRTLWGVDELDETRFRVLDLCGIGVKGAGTTDRSDGLTAAGAPYSAGLGHYEQDHFQAFKIVDHEAGYANSGTGGRFPSRTSDGDSGNQGGLRPRADNAGAPRTSQTTEMQNVALNWIIKY